MTALMITLLTAAVPPVQNVTTADRHFVVNGQPFFPIMIWLQDPGNFPHSTAAGINTVAGYWPGSGGTKDVVEYYQRVADAGFYAVMPFDARLAGRDHLLGYIHDDEPDLTHQESDAEVTPGEGLRLNNSTPLWKIVDGVTSTWSVLDPLEGAQLTIKLKAPVTLTRLGVWLTVSEGLSVAKQVELRHGDTVLATAELKPERGRQEIPLAQPVTLQELTFHVLTTAPGTNVWGSIGEIEGFDADGRNVLLSPPRTVPRQQPEETAARYAAMHDGDPTRPVLMTLTAGYMEQFTKLTDDDRARLYPAYAQAADALGFDIYPIYGWGKPDWIDRVADGTSQLVDLAGNKPVYAWIETSAGSQWVSEQNQKPVEPRHIRAEVWMSIASGATAIGYFTHIWKPAYHQFGVPDANVEAMRAINDQITRLAPALLDQPTTLELSIKSDPELRMLLAGREHDGALYLIAVNADPADQATTATITVPGLKEGTKVEVIDEGRTIAAEAGEFSDGFEGLGVRLYRVRQ